MYDQPSPSRPLTDAALDAFAAQLLREERSSGTIENYLWAARRFAAFLAGAPPTREAALRWKAALLAAGYAPATVNARLSALNRLLGFLGLPGGRVGFVRVQRRIFRPAQRQLARQDYTRLLAAARAAGRPGLALVMQTLCSTGIRVSELAFITVEAARAGRAEIYLKGKARVILLPRALCPRLLRWAGQQGIRSGPVFRARGGAPLGRRQIWRQMKALSAAAGVEESKVYPHNLRHLFAVSFYAASHDLARLADVLGHSSIETTRLYLVTTGSEHRRTLNSLRLVC